MGKSGYYDYKYFEWQKTIGDFGGWALSYIFKDYIKKNHKVIDYGCGGGYLLKNLSAKEKVGIEINPEARKVAKGFGIKTVQKTSKIRNNWADIIISNHALEHVHNPLGELMMLHSKLRKGGKIVFIVPCESILRIYKSNDINQHLYSWNPMSLGNLFTVAGYKVIESKWDRYSWPAWLFKFNGLFLGLFRKLGERNFYKIGKLYGYFPRKVNNVIVVARK